MLVFQKISAFFWNFLPRLLYYIRYHQNRVIMTEKEKKRLEMYEQRYAESWKKREINEEGTLKPFSKEELEHIFMLNDHLKELTSSTIDKTLRVSIHLLDEIEKGYKDFEDYQIESYIGMTYLDDGDETLEEQEWNLGEISCFAQLGFQPLFQLSLHLHGGRHHENQARKLRDEYWNITLTNKGKGRIWQQKCLYALSVITTSITQVSM